ncbi:MAG: RNA-directed DNA polymerase [Cyclobacteriaceae bacterium]|nr:RNA-directed DNA polymerase [Cyclobacteriaceae bacterium]
MESNKLSPEELAKKNEELRNSFLATDSIKKLAVFFNLRHSVLTYRVYKVPEDEKYKEFKLKKKNGGIRIILSPNEKLKFLQRKISDVIYLIYRPLIYSHGFEKGKSVKTNAQIHAKQRFILNIDLKDFFSSINFGRVRGMFMSPPFAFSPEIATILAQICCYKNALPQGAPSSPVISNIICLKLDRQLSKFALENKCYYSRYADDITFSTSCKKFPKQISSIKTGKVKLNTKLESIISKNGFEINEEKISFRSEYQQQIVTGVVVNVSPNVKRKYVRQVRAMLNAWGKYGLEEAEREHFEKYSTKNRNILRQRPSLRDIISGKVHYIGYIRKKLTGSDKLYIKLKKDLEKLIKEEDSIPKYQDNGSQLPLIITEGHTDWKHLKNALSHFKGFKKDAIDVEFWEYEQNLKFGDSVLKKFCLKESHKPKSRKYICIFDRDSPEIIKSMNGDNNSSFKYWGNNVYSFCLPTPSNRENYSNISVEMYYTDSEVNTIDTDTGKSLFFTNQIKETIEVNLTNNTTTQKREILKTPLAINEFDKKIFDYKVDLIKNTTGVQVAHSKTVFASRVYNSHKDFSNFDLSEFEKVFTIISEIIKHNSSQ